MADLLLRGHSIGHVDAVLFDKDGTMSLSEPMLRSLAVERIDCCLELAEQIPGNRGRRADLQDLLERAYGVRAQGVHPAGTTAVASRDQNLVSTATVLVQVGFGWPDALAISEAVFERTDSLHGQGSCHPPQPTDGLRSCLERLCGAGVRCGVISNDHVDGIEAFLASHALEAFFSGIWSAEHHPRKPDPAAVESLCRSMDVPPDRCALIGDADSDLRMARAASVAVVLGYRSGWSQPLQLDGGFLQLDHWQDLQVRA